MHLTGITPALSDAGRVVSERDLRKPRTLIVARGPPGSLWFDGDVVHEQEAVPVENLDRLGTGDALAASDQVVTDRDELSRWMASVAGPGSVER